MPLGAAALLLGLALLGLRTPWGEDLLAQREYAGAARVIDGDSIEIDGTRIRISGIDAPEMAQSCISREGASYPCGRRARAELERLSGGGTVTCRREGRDRFQRVLATCRAGDADLATAMVGAGWAVAYAGSSGDRLRGAERRARDARAGLWAGSFERPEDWRHRAGR